MVGEQLPTELDTLENLIRLAEDYKLKRLKIGEFEIEFFEPKRASSQGVSEDLQYEFEDERKDDFYSTI
tara:strand:- start:1295 stop:1501 length:207 start_codon:yes stop_codon:yes gene_type:complete